MRDVFNAGPNETLLGEIVTSILNWTEGKTLGEAGAPEGWGRGVDGGNTTPKIKTKSLVYSQIHYYK